MIWRWLFGKITYRLGRDGVSLYHRWWFDEAGRCKCHHLLAEHDFNGVCGSVDGLGCDCKILQAATF